MLTTALGKPTDWRRKQDGSMDTLGTGVTSMYKKLHVTGTNDKQSLQVPKGTQGNWASGLGPYGNLCMARWGPGLMGAQPGTQPKGCTTASSSKAHTMLWRSPATKERGWSLEPAMPFLGASRPRLWEKSFYTQTSFSENTSIMNQGELPHILHLQSYSWVEK